MWSLKQLYTLLTKITAALGNHSVRWLYFLSVISVATMVNLETCLEYTLPSYQIKTSLYTSDLWLPYAGCRAPQTAANVHNTGP